MENVDPLISCICVTSDRPRLLQRAISCFERQTYTNKELVVSYPENDVLTKTVIEKIAEASDIKMVIVERPAEESLGKARNRAIDASNGSFICIWDDDDWHHENRVRHQYDVIKNGPFKASILLNILMYDYESKECFLSPSRMWEGTLLAEKATLLEQLYLDKDRGEDTAVVFRLYMNNLLFNVTEASYMYIYIYHGNNTWGESHFNSYFLQSQPLDDKINGQVADLTDMKYYYL